MADTISPDLSASAPPAEVSMPNKSWVYVFGLTLSVMVGGLSSVCIKQLLLPIQVGQLAPGNTNTIFTLVSSVGAGAGLLALPLIGAFSDRTVLRSGRRRPWIALGIAAAVIGMSIMAFARSLPVLLVGEILAQIGVDTVLTTSTALIPDQIPVGQRPFTSACVGIAPNVGGVIGLLLVSHFTDTRNIAQGYVLMAVVSLVAVMFFLAILDDPPIEHRDLPPFHLGRFLLDFVRPLSGKNFAFTFASRCCAYLAFTILGAYTLFYLVIRLHETTPAAATGVATFQLLSTLILVLFAISAGWLSRRTDRMKPFVIGGALGMAIGLGVMVVFPTWTALLIAAAIFGAGFGLFLGVDISLAVRVLPSAQARAKDLGIMYDAIYLPLILSPIIGGGVLNLFHNNFALLFSVAALSSILASVLILPIKGVR
jgi:MFS family permease